jgi:hypothetical protein
MHQCFASTDALIGVPFKTSLNKINKQFILTILQYLPKFSRLLRPPLRDYVFLELTIRGKENFATGTSLHQSNSTLRYPVGGGPSVM